MLPASGAREPARSPWLHLYRVGATVPRARYPRPAAFNLYPFDGTGVASVQRKFFVAKCEISRGRSTKFSLDRRRARSYCADTGSPLRRLRIRHPADSERAHERPVTRSPCDDACTVAEERRRRPRGPAGVERRWPRDGSREAGAASSEGYSGPSRVLPRRAANVKTSQATDTVARVRDHDSLLADLDAHPARRRHRAARAVGDPRAGRVGQDPGAHAPDRVPRAGADRRSAPRARGHVHAPRRGRARRPPRLAGRRRRGDRRHLPRARAGAAPRAAPPIAARNRRRSSTARGGCSRRCWPKRGSNHASVALAVSELATEIEWAKARLIPPEQYAAATRAAERRVPRPAAEMADLYARYESEKRRKRWLDFDDLLGTCSDAIDRDPDFAAAQRWRFRHLFVDEFQDATPLQTRLLRAWLGDRSDLCVVGDGAQAIYAFAGADASPLTQFAAPLPRRPHDHARAQLPVERRDRRGRGSVARARVGRRARLTPSRAPRCTARQPSPPSTTTRWRRR